MNDDLVQAKRGFGAHPHRDVEICTYIVEGELTHKDSMGTAETLQRGEIQYMSAGTGVEHSEHNLGNSPLRFIQIWINTRQRGLKPVYGSLKGNEENRLNKWAHLVQDIKNTNIDCPIKINQDSNIFVTEIDPNISLNLEIQNDRQGYLLCIEGDNNIIQGKDNQIYLSRHDAAEIIGPQTLSITTSNKKSHFLLVEMKYELDSGRKDL
jgi:redox-sensitive bicupin YhaK (pirin superfamily)